MEKTNIEGTLSLEDIEKYYNEICKVIDPLLQEIKKANVIATEVKEELKKIKQPVIVIETDITTPHRKIKLTK